MNEGPKNSYRGQVWAEKLMGATRVRVHPDKEQEFRTLLEGVADKVPHLLKPGGIIVDEHLAVGQVLLEHQPIETGEVAGEVTEEVQ